MGTDNARKDLEALLRSGIKGTAMPSFKQLAENERSSLAAYTEFLALRGRLKKGIQAGKIRRVSKEPEGALRFPIEVERAMMGDAVSMPLFKGKFPELEPITIDAKPFIIPESIEKGMQIDAIQNNRKY